VRRGLSVLCSLALAVAVSATAQARDFEMGGDSPYVYSTTTAPTPNAVTHRAAALHTRHAASPPAAKPVAKQ
jgi:hypothetical protein